MNNKDTYQKFTEYYDIPDYQNNIIISLTNIPFQHNRSIWCVSNAGFWVFSFLMFSIIPRIKLLMITGHTTYNIVKQITIEEMETK